MMKLTVKEVAEAKGIKNATQLGELARIPLASMYRIWNGTARMIGMDTLEKLCTTLDIPVGMLIVHIPEKDRLPGGESIVGGVPRRQPKRSKSEKQTQKVQGARAGAMA